MPENKNQFNKWLALINIPIQMGIVIFVFSYFGKWIEFHLIDWIWLKCVHNKPPDLFYVSTV